MDEQQLRALMCELGRRLHARNLVAATDGNLSVRLEENRYLCTPSGVSKGFMRPQDLLIATGNGEKVAGEGRVTTEFLTHLAAFEERPDVVGVVHAHPPAATALTLAGLSLEEMLLPEVVMSVGQIPTAPYATPGTAEGADAIRQLIKRHDAILLDRHGAVTVGKSLLEAYYKMEKVEHAAVVVLLAHQAKKSGGLTPLDAPSLQRALAAGGLYQLGEAR